MQIETNVAISLEGENGNHGDLHTVNVLLEEDGYLYMEDTSDEAEAWMSLNQSEQKNLLKILIQLHGVPEEA